MIPTDHPTNGTTVPKISVLMTVYNSATYLREAIESILKQTFTNFEFIIINDGSTDESEAIILSYEDERIVYHKNEKNRQLPASLNIGLAMVKGKYVARMDSDDICQPTRFEKQLAFMESHPEVGICGTWAGILGIGEGKVWRFPIKHERMETKLFFSNCISHPSAFIRKSVLDEHNLGYNEEFVRAQDWKLWIEMVQYTRIANIPEVLVFYRRHEQNLTHVDTHLGTKMILKIHRENLNKLHIHFSAQQLNLFSAALRNRIDVDMRSFILIDEMLTTIYRQNQKLKVFDEEHFNYWLLKIWSNNFGRANSYSFRQILDQQWFVDQPKPIQEVLKRCFSFFYKKKHFVNTILFMSTKSQLTKEDQRIRRKASQALYSKSISNKLISILTDQISLLTTTTNTSGEKQSRYFM